MRIRPRRGERFLKVLGRGPVIGFLFLKDPSAELVGYTGREREQAWGREPHGGWTGHDKRGGWLDPGWATVWRELDLRCILEEQPGGLTDGLELGVREGLRMTMPRFCGGQLCPRCGPSFPRTFPLTPALDFTLGVKGNFLPPP